MNQNAAWSGRRISTHLLMAVTMMALGALVAWLSYVENDWLPTGMRTFGWLFLTANLLLVVGVFSFGLIKGIDWFEPIYSISVIFFLIFVARALYITYTPAWSYPFHPEFIPWTLLLGTIGFVSLLVGYALKAGERISRRLPVFSSKWNKSRLILITTVYIAVGLVGYTYAIISSGGFQLFAVSLQGRRLLSVSNNWVFASTLILFHVATLLLVAYFARHRRLALLFLTTCLLAVGSSLLLGGRSDALITILAAIVIFYYVRFGGRRHLIRQTPVVIVTAITFFLLVVIVGTLRWQGAAGRNVLEVDVASTVISGGVARRFLLEFNQLDWFAATLELVPEKLPFQWGQSFLQFFSMFVPRALWAGKPEPLAFHLNRIAGGPGFGSPPSLMGELYINFSVPGIIAGMFLFGVVARMLYAYLRANPQNLAVVALYAYSFASIHRFFTRSFAPKLFGYVLFIVPMLFALWFVQERRMRADS